MVREAPKSVEESEIAERLIRMGNLRTELNRSRVLAGTCSGHSVQVEAAVETMEAAILSLRIGDKLLYKMDQLIDVHQADQQAALLAADSAKRAADKAEIAAQTAFEAAKKTETLGITGLTWGEVAKSGFNVALSKAPWPIAAAICWVAWLVAHGMKS